MLTCAIPNSNSPLLSPGLFLRAGGLPGKRPASVAGFTLLEILVVLFIVSIMSGVVVANLPSFAQSGDFDTETRRLKTLLDLARLESQVQAEEFGFNPSEQGYEFLVYDERNRSWQVSKEKPFTRRELAPEFSLRVRIEDSDLNISAPPEATITTTITTTTTSGAPRKKPPPILILSSGEITPFEMTLTGRDELSRTLVTDGIGDLHWQDEKAAGAPDER